VLAELDAAPVGFILWFRTTRPSSEARHPHRGPVRAAGDARSRHRQVPAAWVARGGARYAGWGAWNGRCSTERAALRSTESIGAEARTEWVPQRLTGAGTRTAGCGILKPPGGPREPRRSARVVAPAPKALCCRQSEDVLARDTPCHKGGILPDLQRRVQACLSPSAMNSRSGFGASDADLRKLTKHVADFAEQSSSRKTLDALYAIESEGRLELQKVVHALARMDPANTPCAAVAVVDRRRTPGGAALRRHLIGCATEQGAYRAWAVETLKATRCSRHRRAGARVVRTAELRTWIPRWPGPRDRRDRVRRAAPGRGLQPLPSRPDRHRQAHTGRSAAGGSRRGGARRAMVLRQHSTILGPRSLGPAAGQGSAAQARHEKLIERMLVTVPTCSAATSTAVASATSRRNTSGGARASCFSELNDESGARQGMVVIAAPGGYTIGPGARRQADDARAVQRHDEGRAGSPKAVIEELNRRLKTIIENIHDGGRERRRVKGIDND